MLEENQVKLVPHSEIQMLGVALGSDSYVSSFVEETVGSPPGHDRQTDQLRGHSGRLFPASGVLQHRPSSTLHALAL